MRSAQDSQAALLGSPLRAVHLLASSNADDYFRRPAAGAAGAGELLAGPRDRAKDGPKGPTVAQPCRTLFAGHI